MELHDFILYPLSFLRVASNLLMTGPKVNLNELLGSKIMHSMKTNTKTTLLLPEGPSKICKERADGGTEWRGGVQTPVCVGSMELSRQRNSTQRTETRYVEFILYA